MKLIRFAVGLKCCGNKNRVVCICATGDVTISCMEGKPAGVLATLGKRVDVQALRIVLAAFLVETYITRRVTVDAIQYNGDNVDEIESFAGAENIRVNNDGNVEIQLTDHRMIIRVNWWVTKDTTTGVIGLSSDRAFERFFQPVIGAESFTSHMELEG